jgi:hypothetical protein
MTFKPFKPPLIRKPLEQPTRDVIPFGAPNDERQVRPLKRRKLSGKDGSGDEHDGDDDDFSEIRKEEVSSISSNSKPWMMSSQLSYRKPLLPATNGSSNEAPTHFSTVAAARQTQTDSTQEADNENEVYYNVLWWVLPVKPRRRLNFCLLFLKFGYLSIYTL